MLEQRESVDPRWSAIPLPVIRRLALIFTEGEDKYGQLWKTGPAPFTSTIDHLLEHLCKYQEGDRSEDHLAKAMWGLVCLMYHEQSNVDDWTDQKCREGFH